jgi:hypothetical protein
VLGEGLRGRYRISKGSYIGTLLQSQTKLLKNVSTMDQNAKKILTLGQSFKKILNLSHILKIYSNHKPTCRKKFQPQANMHMQN